MCASPRAAGSWRRTGRRGRGSDVALRMTGWRDGKRDAEDAPTPARGRPGRGQGGGGSQRGSQRGAGGAVGPGRPAPLRGRPETWALDGAAGVSVTSAPCGRAGAKPGHLGAHVVEIYTTPRGADRLGGLSETLCPQGPCISEKCSPPAHWRVRPSSRVVCVLSSRHGAGAPCFFSPRSACRQELQCKHGAEAGRAFWPGRRKSGRW